MVIYLVMLFSMGGYGNMVGQVEPIFGLSKLINQILDFLGWSINETQRKNVLTYCSFDWMKANTHRFTGQGNNEKSHFKPGGFIRKGQVGGGKAMLSAEQEQRVMDLARDRLEPGCLKFLGIRF